MLQSLNDCARLLSGRLAWPLVLLPRPLLARDRARAFAVVRWRIQGDAAEQYVCELACGVLVRDVEQAAAFVPEGVVERVVDDHAEKGAHDDGRFDLAERTVALTFAYVAAEQLVHLPHVTLPE